MLQAQGIPRESVSDAVADKILANISSGVYRPGSNSLESPPI